MTLPKPISDAIYLLESTTADSALKVGNREHRLYESDVAEARAALEAAILAMAREILRLRSELEKAQAEVQRLEGERVGPLYLCKDGKPITCDAPPPKFTPEQVRDCMTEPPADVLGEAFRSAMVRADAADLGLASTRHIALELLTAMHELAQVVERIARQQGGGK